MNLFWTPPTLETDRLWLRPFCLADVAAVFEYSSDPALTEYTLWETHETPADSLAFVNDYAVSRYAEEVPEPLGIFTKDRPEWAIGSVGCYWTSQPHLSMEVGYALARSHWGRGLATEAARAVVGHAFAEYPVERMQARVFVGNRASMGVVRKLGMTLEGTLRRCVCRRGRFWDLQYHSVLRHEWESESG